MIATIYLSGLSAFGLGFACLALRYARPAPTGAADPVGGIAWGRLGLFGLTQGLHHWWSLTLLAGEESAAAEGARSLLLVLSLLLLADAGRVSVSTAGRRSPPAILAAALLVTGLGGLAGWPGVRTAAALTLALPGGLAVSRALHHRVQPR